ncbi:MAG: hypothetical protein EA359_07545 [Balneolaceae bacterium]|nr:MAG: hypothetical protein EA359_07545 [Balneolaceae bacterium]
MEDYRRIILQSDVDLAQRIMCHFHLHYYLLMLILFLMFIPGMAFTQNSTQVTIVGIPPILPSPFISDFEQNVFSGRYHVHLNVFGGGSTPVNLEFRVEVYKDGRLIVDEVSFPVAFSPGFHILSPFPDFVEFPATTNDILQGLPDNMFRQVVQTGSFPEGDYSVIMRAERVGTTAQNSIPGQSNFMVRYPQPPNLLTPVNNSGVFVQVPVFSWAPAIVPPGVTVEYDVLIVELFDGQNPGDAILSNREHAFLSVINNTIFPYTGEFLPLEQGRTYAWQVIARDVADQYPFKNEGRSEINIFSFGQDPGSGQEAPVLFLPPVADMITAVPVTSISGSIKWRFRPVDGQDGQPGYEPIILQNLLATNNASVSNAIDDPNLVVGDNTDFNEPLFINPSSNIATVDLTGAVDPDGNATGVVPVFGGGTSTGVQLGMAPATESIQQEIQNTLDILTAHPYSGAKVRAMTQRLDGTFAIIATTTADENGDFQLFFAPSELKEVAFESSSTPITGLESLGLEAEPQQVNMQQTGLGSGGMASVDLGSILMGDIKIYIRVDSDYIGFSQTTTIDVNPNTPQSYNLGTILGTALTYRLQPRVIDKETGEPIPDAFIEVFRSEAFYNIQPVLKPEGAPIDEDRRGDIEQIWGRNHLKVAELRGESLITRLFPRRNSYAGDRYAIRISAPGYHTFNSFIVANPNTTMHDIVTVSITYELNPGAPAVVGRVIRRDNQEPLHNVSVTLHNPQAGSPAEPQYASQTDREGGFIITDIDPDAYNYYVLTVSGAGVSQHQEEVVFQPGQIVTERTITVDPAMIKVRGRVINDEEEPVSNAIIQWAAGGVIIHSDNDGFFETANNVGNHLLRLQKIGHRDQETEVSIVTGPCDEEVFMPSQVNSGDIGFFNNNALRNNLLGTNGQACGSLDIGTVVMDQMVGRLLVTVESETGGEPIPGATVTVGLADLQGITEQDGSVYFGRSPAGAVPLHIRAPGTTNFVPLQTEVSVTDNGDTTRVTLQMETGGRATGRVFAEGQPVENARIRVIGRDDIYTRSDLNGDYTLPGIPTGEWELRAARSGYVGDRNTAIFSADQTVFIDFELGVAGFDISELLGFEIEVDNLVIDSDTTLSGAFVSISSNSLFSIHQNVRLPFSNIKVFEQNGVLYPVDGEVVTNRSEILAKVFDFLFLRVKNEEGLTVRPRELLSSGGYIAGRVEVDYTTTFTTVTGWQWSGDSDQYLTLPNTENLPSSIGETELVVLTSDGSFPFPEIGIPDFEFSFGSASQAFSLYGFNIELNLNESALRNDGFHMQGDIQFANIPVLSQASLTLEKLWIGTDGSVREASLELDPRPSFPVANWDMEISAGTLTEAGLLLGGALLLNLPQTETTTVTFSQLGISSGMLHGGQFVFPEAGINVFGIAHLKTPPGSEISLGRLQGQNVYFLRGSAELQLPRLINRTLEFSNFYIRTDGQFDAAIAANFNADFFGLADLSVTGVQFMNTSSPGIRIDGHFGLRAIPFVSAQAGGLTYRPGGSVSFDELQLGFDIVGIAAVSVGLGLIDTATSQGFSGSGSFSIRNTSISPAIEFFYERRQAGIAFGADIETGITIPVGNFVIENVGGGFSYQPSNSYSVTLSGRVAVAPGTGRAIALDPLLVTLRSGPVIEGFADLTVIGESIGNASLRIDFPQRFFDVEAQLSFSMLERVNISANAATRVVISAAPDNPFWMAGVRFNARLAGLFNTNANILAAWNVRQDAYPQYTGFVRDVFVTGGRITGLHLDVEVLIGSKNEKCAGFFVGEACGYFYNRTNCQLNIDFGGGNFGFYIGSDWRGGGRISFLILGDLIGADARASGSVSGSYINNIWAANGSASGFIRGFVGSNCPRSTCYTGWCGDDWWFIPDGASLCGSASISVDYRSDRGLDFSFGLD